MFDRPVLALCALATVCVVAGCPEPQRVGPPVHLDPDGFLCIGTRRFFPREIYGAKTREDYAVLAWAGFNTVIEGTPDTAELADAFGMKFVCPNWFDTGFDPDKARQWVQRWSPARGLIAWNVHDEPDLRAHRSPATTIARVAQLVRDTDPLQRPVSVTLSGARGATRLWPEFAAAVDLLRVDPYPVLSGQPLTLVSDRVRLGREAAQYQKPVWAVLQAWCPGHLPSAAQHRVMTYLALVAGCRGLSAFDFNFQTWRDRPDLWNALALTHWELRRLERVLLHNRRTYIHVSHPGVYARGLRWRGLLYVWIVNPSDQPAVTEVDLPALPGQSRVVRCVAEDALHQRRSPAFVLSGSRFVLRMRPLEARLLEVGVGDRVQPDLSPILSSQGRVCLVQRRAPGHYLIKNLDDDPREVVVAVFQDQPVEAWVLDVAGRALHTVPTERRQHRLRLTCPAQTYCEIGTRQQLCRYRRDQLVEALHAEPGLGDLASAMRSVRFPATAPDQRWRAAYGQLLDLARRTGERPGVRPAKLGRDVRELAHWVTGMGIAIKGSYRLTRGFDVPALRHRSFPQASHALTLHVRPPKGWAPQWWRVRLVDDRTGRPLRVPAPTVADPREPWQRTYRFGVPAGPASATDRAVRVEWVYGGGFDENVVWRKVRLALQQPFGMQVVWGRREPGQAQAELVLKNRFAGYPFGALRVRCRALPRGWGLNVTPDVAGSPGTQPSESADTQPSGPTDTPRLTGPVRMRLAVTTPRAPDWQVHRLSLDLVGGDTVWQHLRVPGLMVGPDGVIVHGTHDRRQAVCRPLAQKAPVDGSLTGAMFGRAPTCYAMHRAGTADLADVQTRVWVAYDKQYLHVAGQVRGRAQPAIRAEATGHDKPGMADDVVAIAWAPARSSRQYYVVGVNAAGTTFDVRWRLHSDGRTWRPEVGWNSGVVAEAKTAEAGWQFYMRVSLTSLGVFANPGTELGWNVYAARDVAPRSAELWSDCPEGRLVPAHFGRLVFGAGTGSQPTTRPSGATAEPSRR